MSHDIIYTILASIMASIGLDTNNLTALIGSMLVSPLSNPIINIMNNEPIQKNILLLLIYIIICISIGIIYHKFVYTLIKDFKITDEMKSRGINKKFDYIYDIMYAIIAGICIYMGSNILNRQVNNMPVLIGVSIGISILPSFVNSGIMFSSGNYSNGVYSSILGLIYLIGLMGGIKIAVTGNNYLL